MQKLIDIVTPMLHKEWEISEPWSEHVHVSLEAEKMRGFFSPTPTGWEFFSSDPSLRDEFMESFEADGFQTERFEKEGNYYLKIFKTL